MFGYNFTSGNFGGNLATVGINRGNGVDFPVSPGTSGGSITGTTSSLLPLVQGDFVLLRAIRPSSHQVSINGVPEPSAGVVGLLGAGLLLDRRRA